MVFNYSLVCFGGSNFIELGFVFSSVLQDFSIIYLNDALFCILSKIENNYKIRFNGVNS